MSYKTLYRKYRPQNFNEFVGQEHIRRTFKNALKKDKIAHAYLFTGPRGTGKTSAAKIIAKTVNCAEAPTSEPCNECESCKSINTGFDNDVFEIDAASNNGVDEIREIRDKVKYAPSLGRFKVYIIDEVHMLSTGAFNALLKTLEEPPKHVIFILATTEPHKIPATIISRCQRFDFKSISIKDMISRIKFIVHEENIRIEDTAILTIAKNALGGMRDALSLLDQAISYSDEVITEENVHEITGTVSEDDLAHIVSCIIKNDAPGATQYTDRLISNGKEPLRLMENFIYYFRDLFLLKKLKSIDEEFILYHNDKTIQISKHINEKELFDVINILNNAQYEMRKTNYPRVFIELAIFEIISTITIKEDLQDINEETYQADDRSEDHEVYQEPENEFEENEYTDTDTENNVSDEYEEEQIGEEESGVSIEESKENKESNVEKKDLLEEKYIDVKEIEDVLNNANKEKKLNLILQWNSLQGHDLNYTNIIQLLLDGTIEAVSNDNKIILSYEYDAICAKMYEEEINSKAKEIISDVFKEPYSFIALPLRIWNDKKEEFIKQFKNKVKKPKLSPITEPILVKKNKDKYEFESEMVKEAINLFGDKIIDIKK